MRQGARIELLTRIKVSGFKNLVDADIRFGPFTCIAGPNGVGKSNLFDAIHFLSALADKNLIDAALSIRDEEGKTADLRSIFHKCGEQIDPQMSFDVEMIIPEQGHDDFGREAKASITYLKYSLKIKYKEGSSGLGEPGEPNLGRMEIVEEKLEPIRLGVAPKYLLFPHNAGKWRRSAVSGRRTGPYISTDSNSQPTTIKLHMDRGTGGRPQSFPAAASIRTILSSSNIADSQTTWLARQEMLSWRQLLLEPSSLRKPDDFRASNRLGNDGAHLPATLYRLARRKNGNSDTVDEDRVYSQVAKRLAELIGDVRKVWIYPDQVRQLFILKLRERGGTELDARSMSDGSLRFLALAVLELDPEEQGLICLEEPENGIHPERIPAMLKLLMDIAVDVDQPIGPENPLRQVIINTHSPAVVAQVPDDSLLVAESKETIKDGIRFNKTVFSCLRDTWRVTGPNKDNRPFICPKGKLLAYLNPTPSNGENEVGDENASRGKRVSRRVIDRDDLWKNSLFTPDHFPK